jgi:hypothetical protein
LICRPFCSFLESLSRRSFVASWNEPMEVIGSKSAELKKA